MLLTSSVEMLGASSYSRVSSLFAGVVTVFDKGVVDVGIGDVAGAVLGDGDGVGCLVVGNGVEAFGEMLIVSVVLGFKMLFGGDRLR